MTEGCVTARVCSRNLRYLLQIRTLGYLLGSQRKDRRIRSSSPSRIPLPPLPLHRTSPCAEGEEGEGGEEGREKEPFLRT